MMTEEQRSAILRGIVFLDYFAGEGFCMQHEGRYLGADDVIYNLWNAFNLPEPEESYTETGLKLFGDKDD